MSTIVARFNLDGRPVDAAALRQMLEVQHHRGPGRKQVWAEGAVALGHGANPISDHTRYPLEEDGLVLVADMRLDNREDLMRALKVDVPADEDGPLLLAAYRKWGADCVAHLRGDFAFVLWDMAAQRLVAARDIFGVRALFYHYVPGQHVILSSEIKGLFCHPEVEKKLDEIRLAEAIQLVDSDVTRTMYEEVRALHAGHYMFVERSGERKIKRYWSPEKVPPWNGDASDDGYAQELLRLLRQAVVRRMRGTSRIGVELSGGLDSSALAVLARDERLRKGEPPLFTLSLRFPDYPEVDEGSYIDAVLETGHMIPRAMNGGGRSTLTNVEEVLQVMDDPSLVGANHHHVWMRLELAKSNNVSVVFTGYDGDSVVGHGFERYHELARAGNWGTFRQEIEEFEKNLLDAGSGPEDQIYLNLASVLHAFGIGELRGAAERSEWGVFTRVLNGLHRHFGLPRLVLMRRFVRRLITPYLLIYRKRVANFVLTPFVREEVAERTSLRVRAAEVELNKLVWPQTTRGQQERLLHSPLYLRTIEALDLYGAAFGIEVRHPFLDQDLVEFCLTLPSEQRLRDGWTRFVMRRALQGVLPEKVRLRPGKTSFAAATSQAMLDLDRSKIEATLKNPGSLRSYLHLERASEVLRSPVAEWGKDAIRLGQIVALSMWLERMKSEGGAKENATVNRSGFAGDSKL